MWCQIVKKKNSSTVVDALIDTFCYLGHSASHSTLVCLLRTPPSNKVHLASIWISFAFSHGWHLAFLCGSRALFMGPASTYFSKFFFKTRSHDTIHTFKNYFVTVFSVFSNKRYPDKHIASIYCAFLFFPKY